MHCARETSGLPRTVQSLQSEGVELADRGRVEPLPYLSAVRLAVVRASRFDVVIAASLSAYQIG